MRSPRIVSVAWGRMEVEGLGVGKDFVLFPGGGHEWDWGATGMSHNPGIRPVEVDLLLARGATIVVLSRGMDLQLGIDPSTLDHLRDRGIEVRVHETREAVAVYNELINGYAVGGLFHSTC